METNNILYENDNVRIYESEDDNEAIFETDFGSFRCREFFDCTHGEGVEVFEDEDMYIGIIFGWTLPDLENPNYEEITAFINKISELFLFGS